MRQLIRIKDPTREESDQTGSKYIFQAYEEVRNKVSYDIRKLQSECYTKKTEESTGDLTKIQMKLTKSMVTVKPLQTRKLSQRSQTNTLFRSREVGWGDYGSSSDFW